MWVAKTTQAPQTQVEQLPQKDNTRTDGVGTDFIVVRQQNRRTENENSMEGTELKNAFEVLGEMGDEGVSIGSRVNENVGEGGRGNVSPQNEHG